MKTAFNFNILEILDLSKKIEYNGERFYRKAAEKCPKHSKFFLDLAIQEQGHKKVLNNIRENILSEEDPYVNDPEGIIKSYLDAIANGLIFDNDSDFANFNDLEIEDIMNVAIEREEDTILFFQETLKILKNEEDKNIMFEIIEEELGHIDWIKEQKNNLIKRHPLL